MSFSLEDNRLQPSIKSFQQIGKLKRFLECVQVVGGRIARSVKRRIACFDNRGNQTRYVTVVTKHLFFVMHRPRSDGTRNYNRYMTKL